MPMWIFFPINARNRSPALAVPSAAAMKRSAASVYVITFFFLIGENPIFLS